jgi:hypothetical protein
MFRFTDALLSRPPVSRCDAIATLRHFAIISYAVDPEKVRPHVHPRFDLDSFIESANGPRVLVSMVPFEDQDFHFAGARWVPFAAQDSPHSVLIQHQTEFTTFLPPRELPSDN